MPGRALGTDWARAAGPRNPEKHIKKAGAPGALDILYVSPAYRQGAGQIAELERQMKARGHSVSRLEAPHLPARTLKSASFALSGSSLAALGKKHDVVHAFNVPSAFAMRFSRARKKILTSDAVWSRYIRESHSRPLAALASFTERRVMPWADALTSDSEFTAAAYEGMLGLRFARLRHPMDPGMFGRFDAVKEVPGRVCFVGRDSREKGRDVLEAAEKGIDGRVSYVADAGWAEAMSLVKSSQVLAVPSRIESLPRIIIEAFFMGVPVVASSVGGVPELVERGRTGALVPPGDPAALAEAVNGALSDRREALRMARTAREEAHRRFSSENVMPGYARFYEELLA